MAQDTAGNTYVTGAASANGLTYDIRTIKLDTAFQVLWEKDYGIPDLDDSGLAIDVDPSGNVYVGGAAAENSSQKQYTVIKYNSLGTEQWVQKLNNETGQSGIVKDLQLSPYGKVIVTGELFSTTQTEIVTLSYDENGKMKWYKSYDHTITPGDHILQLRVFDDANIWVTGVSTLAGSDRYRTLKYEIWERDIQIENDSLGIPEYVKNEIIIRFSSSALLPSPFESTRVKWGNANDFIQPSVIVEMEQKLGETNLSSWKTLKVHRNLTLADTVSVSRAGYMIRMPAFWTTLILKMPESASRSASDEQVTADSLQTLSSIIYAEPNFVGEPVASANDPFYSDQASFRPTSLYNNAHINIEGAWDIETGKQHVKVGVHDTGIRWSHEDFGDGTFAGSRVKGGWDWVGDIPIDTDPDNDVADHGTRTAGIVGAIRNNMIGVAGVAGGDELQSISGVELYNMKISKNNSKIPYSDAIASIIEGASQISAGFGYGLHIMNHSWGGKKRSSNLEDAVRFAWHNGVIFIASRGNNGNDKRFYPATYRDGWVVSVGATGTEGIYKSTLTGENWWASNFGREIDLSAPGDGNLIFTTTAESNNSYGSHNGTSASVPHVAGVTSLMLSHINQPFPSTSNLAPEDIEFLLQKYANDVIDPLYSVSGYDEYTGWGRLNASAALNMLALPRYEIFHAEGIANSSHITQTGTNQLVFITSGSLAEDISSGYFYADIYRMEITVPHNFPSGTTILDFWPRNSASELMGVDAVAEEDIVVTQCNTTQATLVGYAYHLNTSISGQNINTWIPYNPYNQSSRLSYSVHLDHQTATRIETPIENTSAWVTPNPSQGWINIYYKLTQHSEIRAEIMDLTGKVIYRSETLIQPPGEYKIPVDLTPYAESIYLCRLSTGRHITNIRVIKTN
ncbi:MAG: S8 family serine peptidase [Bacteroidia bacterium]